MSVPPFPSRTVSNWSTRSPGRSCAKTTPARLAAGRNYERVGFATDLFSKRPARMPQSTPKTSRHNVRRAPLFGPCVRNPTAPPYK